MAENKFYMVWGEHRSVPTCKHDTRATAKAEADRLASRFGGKFYVMEAQSFAERVEVQHTDLDDIP